MVSLSTLYKVYKTTRFVYNVYTQNPIRMMLLYELYCISRCIFIAKIQNPTVLTTRIACINGKDCFCDDCFLEIEVN